MTAGLPISLEDVRAAAEVIRGNVLRTPLLPAPRLTALAGTPVAVKYENLQVTNAFKEAGDDATFKPGLTVLGLKENGVGYALDDNNKALIPDDIKAKVDDFSTKIQAGEIKVHDYTADNSCPA